MMVAMPMASVHRPMRISGTMGPAMVSTFTTWKFPKRITMADFAECATLAKASTFSFISVSFSLAFSLAIAITSLAPGTIPLHVFGKSSTTALKSMHMSMSLCARSTEPSRVLSTLLSCSSIMFMFSLTTMPRVTMPSTITATVTPQSDRRTTGAVGNQLHSHSSWQQMQTHVRIAMDIPMHRTNIGNLTQPFMKTTHSSFSAL
mmetsp:Transcript_68863/g.151794  ORF Transcript_68863/g.151794 Transcript_68863/m.151794 type:complete len:204 (-) Transcript_68863:442-1053(-)